MTTTSPLKLEPLTLEDTPALVNIFFAAFANAGPPDIFPDTPNIRQWLTDANSRDIINKPFQKYLKVVDTSQIENGRPRLAAYAKWDLSMPDERGSRYPPWHPDMPAEACDAFFGKEEENRMRVMGDVKHYYLDTVVTHPEYQRRGCGSMLVKWGCELADREGVSAYVDASKVGAPLYAKYGFVDYSNPGEDIASMARFAKE